MAVHAPSHRLIYFAPYSMHLSDLPVTRCTLDSCANVGLVRVKGVRFGFEPVHATPRRLLFSFCEPRKFLNLRTFSLDRFVATHARCDVWNRRVRRLIYVLVTEGAFKLWGFVTLLGHVLPVIELDRLSRRFRLSRSPQQHEPDHQDRHNDKY
jgi:hypothetical protein